MKENILYKTMDLIKEESCDDGLIQGVTYSKFGFKILLTKSVLSGFDTLANKYLDDLSKKHEDHFQIYGVIGFNKGLTYEVEIDILQNNDDEKKLPFELVLHNNNLTI